MEKRRGTAARASLSVVIVAALSLQTVVTFRLERKFAGPPPYLYPFIDYPMYSQPRYEGDAVERERVVAILADGTERAVEPEDLGIGYWIFRREVVETLRAGRAERLALFADRVEARHGTAPVAFRLEIEPLLVTAQGLVAGDLRVVQKVALRGAH